MLQPPDPAWFYSSLAQVTAAIVGFLGGFIIVRLVGFMSEWRETADTIWSTGAAYDAKRIEKKKAQGNPATLPAIEFELDRLWAELQRLLRRRERAQFPRVVTWLAVGLLALTGVGIIWPLLELDGPSNHRQLVFLLSWMVVILLAAVAIAVEAAWARRSLTGTRVSDDAEAEYATYKLQFEQQLEGKDDG